MSSQNVDNLIAELYNKYGNIKTICLLKSDGNFSTFLTKNKVEDSEKKRLAASIMASIVLAERSVINLIQEHVKHVIFKSEDSITIIYIGGAGNYLYILAEKDFDHRNIFPNNFSF